MSEVEWSTLTIRELSQGRAAAVQTGPFGSQLHADDYVEDGVPFILIRNIGDAGLKEGEIPKISTADATRLQRYSLVPGDIVFSRVGRTGSCFLATESERGWIISGQTLRLRLQNPDLDSEFLLYALRSDVVQDFVSRSSVGTTRESLNTEILYSIPIRHPRPCTQQRIAEILSTVDEAIEQTEALIAKTQQIKAGLMHDLFTRGVTPDGQLRPLREEAPQLYKESPLGWIPKEWECDVVEQLLDRIIDYRGKTPTKTGAGVPLITAKNVRMGFIDPEPREFISDSDYKPWMTRGIPRATDVLFTTEAPLGNVAQVGTTEKVAFAQRVIILQPRSGVSPGFLKYRLMATDFQLGAARRSSGTTALGIKQSEFRKIITTYPQDEEEQRAIERIIFATDEREKLDFGTQKKLDSQKRGLMNDLLTGRVLVGPAAATNV